MKNMIIIVLCAAGLLGWVMFVHQNIKFDETAQRIEQSLVEQLVYKSEAQERIKREVLSREQSKDFLSQQEYMRQFEDKLSQRLDLYNTQSEGFKKQLEDSLNKQLDDYKQQQSEHWAQLEEFKIKLEGSVGRSLEEFKQLLSGYQAQLEEQKELLDNYKAQGEEYARQLAQYKERLAGYEKQLADYRQKLEADKQTQQ